jgi:segregation and condensation protein B
MTSSFADGADGGAANEGAVNEGAVNADVANDDAVNADVASDSGAGDATVDDEAIGQDPVSDGEVEVGASVEAIGVDAVVDDAVDDDVIVEVVVGDEVNVGDPVDGDPADGVTEAADVAEGGLGVDDEADIEELDGPGVRASLEAILLVADEPVPEVLLAQVLERPRGEIDAALRALAAEYTADGRGFDLREIAGGWRFYTREDCAPLVERFVRDGQEVRLTQAALETLAVIAYRQPVSRARVSAVRGVNCDGVIRTLVLRGLVEDSGTDQETGAILYRTTGYFLERLGMASLDELPDLAPFLPENIEDIEDNERTRA